MCFDFQQADHTAGKKPPISQSKLSALTYRKFGKYGKQRIAKRSHDVKMGRGKPNSSQQLCRSALAS